MAEKYLDLSGLQAFYDKLKTTAFVDSALDVNSTKPVQNRIVTNSLGILQTDLTTLKNASGTWDAKQDAIEDLDGIRNSAKSGWSAWSAVTVNSATWASETFTGVSTDSTLTGNGKETPLGVAEVQSLTSDNTINITSANNEVILGVNGTWFNDAVNSAVDVPTGVMVESACEYNAVNEISGYNGSAIAQYGAEKQWLQHDDTLVHAANSAQYALGVNLSAVAQLLGVDETVLFSGTPTSAVTLSESMENFDYLRLYFNLGAIDKPNHVITCRYSPVMTVSWGQGVLNAYQTIAYISANPTAMKVIHSRQVALGSFESTAAANTTGTLDSTNALNTITKVVGVHRISEV